MMTDDCEAENIDDGYEDIIWLENPSCFMFLLCEKKHFQTQRHMMTHDVAPTSPSSLL